MVHTKIFLADVEYNNEQNNSQTTEEQWLQYTSMKVKIPLASLVLDGFKSFRGFCALLTWKEKACQQPNQCRRNIVINIICFPLSFIVLSEATFGH